MMIGGEVSLAFRFGHITDFVTNYDAVINARMRRIDLLCKLLGPLAISFVATASTLVAIWTVLGMNTLSVLIEYICIARVCV